MEDRKQSSSTLPSTIVGWFSKELGSRYNPFLIVLSIAVGILCALKPEGSWAANPFGTIVWTAIAFFAIGIGFGSALEGFKKTVTVILVIIAAVKIFL